MCFRDDLGSRLLGLREEVMKILRIFMLFPIVRFERTLLRIGFNREPKQIFNISDVFVDRRIRQSSHGSPELLCNENTEIVYRLDMYLFIRDDSALFHMSFSGFKLRLEQCNNIIMEDVGLEGWKVGRLGSPILPLFHPSIRDPSCLPFLSLAVSES